jgi:hypothetical protein
MPAYVNLDSIHRATTSAVAPAIWGDTVNDDLNVLYGDTAWTAVTFSGTWANFSTDVCHFLKSGNQVIVEGACMSGTINTAAFTLPAGYRPSQALNFGTVTNTGFGSIAITTGGVVTPATGGTGWFSVCCTFSVL